MKKHVEILSNNRVLRGYLTLPDNIKKPPLVCIFHGFTGNKMEDHFYFVTLSKELEKLGIASLRMDFMGTGESDGEFKDMTPSSEIMDGKNIVDWAYDLEEIDNKNLCLFGFSMGGMVAAIVAAEKSDKVKALCLASPAANMRNIFEGFFKNTEEPLVNINGLLCSRKAYEDMKTIDPLERAKDYLGEVLLIQGTADDVVPPVVTEKYKAVYGDRVKYHFIEGADHGYRNKLQETQLIKAICEYFSK